MNLETKIDKRIWTAINNNHEKGNYTNAILDAIYFLSQLIREKTGLESDGSALIGQAFGGKSPKLKVNSLQSESDWNVQKGIEQILRGIFQSIRNPRSHEKYTDSKDDADAIILFLHYLVKIIDQSKSPFSKSIFIKQVFDKDFVKSDRYAMLLISEIPQKLRLDVLIDVNRNKGHGDGRKLAYFVRNLYNQLSDEDKAKVHEMLSKELKFTDDSSHVRLILQIFPSSIWPNYEEAARLRTENKLIQSINDGSYHAPTQSLQDGILGTWAIDYLEHFSMKNELLQVLLSKLSSENRRSQDYVFQYFFYEIMELIDSPSGRYIGIVKNALTSGDVRYFNVLKLPWEPDWIDPFAHEIANFFEVEPDESVYSDDDDDLPF